MSLRFGSDLSLLKYIFRRGELTARLEEFLAIYRPLYSGSRWDFLVTDLRYLTQVVPRLPREKLESAVAAVFTENQGAIMETIAEEWIQEGKEIGLAARVTARVTARTGARVTARATKGGCGFCLTPSE